MAWEPRTASWSFDSDNNLSQDSLNSSLNFLDNRTDEPRISSPYLRPPGRCETVDLNPHWSRDSPNSSDEFYFPSRDVDQTETREIHFLNLIDHADQSKDSTSISRLSVNGHHREPSLCQSLEKPGIFNAHYQDSRSKEDLHDDLAESKYTVSRRKLHDGCSKSKTRSKSLKDKNVFRSFLSPVPFVVASIPPKKLLVGRSKIHADEATDCVVVTRTIMSENKKRNISVLTVSTKESTAVKSTNPPDSDSNDSSDFTRPSDGVFHRKAIAKQSMRKEVTSERKKSLELPTLETEEEKELLSDVFMEWQKEIEETSGRITGGELGDFEMAAPDVIKRGVVPNIAENIQVNLVGTRSTGDVMKRQNSANEVSLSKRFRNVDQKIVHSTSFSFKSTSSGDASNPGAGYLNLQSMLADLPDDANWDISPLDAARGNGRYLQRRESNMKKSRVCIRCGKPAHTRNDFCQTSICTLCHGNDHYRPHCPFAASSNATSCSRCFKLGHIDVTCPEIWRQFHSTISPVDPQRMPAPPKKENVSCGNCGGAGHFAYSCKKQYCDQTVTGFPNPQIKFYDSFASHISSREKAPSLDLFHAILSETSLPFPSGCSVSFSANRLCPTPSRFKKKRTNL